jgi:hypothetical protein
VFAMTIAVATLDLLIRLVICTIEAFRRTIRLAPRGVNWDERAREVEGLNQGERRENSSWTFHIVEAAVAAYERHRRLYFGVRVT